MIQTTLSVPLEVKPESSARLSSLIGKFKHREDQPENKAKENFARLTEQIPTLHFMSLSVFEDPIYDPIFVIEVNFDGPPRPLWAQLDAIAGETIRDMLRCCKRPLDKDAALYESVTEPDSDVPVARYLEARTQRPSVYHHGNRGLTREQIVNEAKLFRAIRAELDAPDRSGPNPYYEASPKDIHKRLREKLEPGHPWLTEASPVRIPRLQKLGDFWRLQFYAAAVLLAFSLPGILAAALIGNQAYLAVLAILAVVAVLTAYLLREPLKGTEVKTDFSFLSYIPLILLILLLPLALVIIFGLAFVGLVDAFLVNVVAGDFAIWWKTVAKTIFLGQLSLFFTVPAIVSWLRYLEKRDSSQAAPPLDETRIADMANQEDWVTQNHMGSIVHIRPGVLRALIVRAGHLGLGLLLRWRKESRDGYLGSMRTVHYAHWAFLNNGSRLLFVSNFDHSWGSYLDDFIEKAHVGLTLAWGCGVGFPTTRFLILDGASHGRLFKTWALASRTTSRFWYSAYPDLSVDQIERNHQVANGLRRQDLSADETLEWLRKL